jgi:McrBC 5-methylcytosine restriction system component
VPGTLLALIGAATGSELRIEAEKSPATDLDAISRHLMSEFTAAASAYVADRRKPRYRYRSGEGPILAGGLDMARTMRLHAGGKLGMFAYHQGSVVRDEPLDRLVLAGLDALDNSATALQLDAGTLYSARWLAGALEDVRDQRYLTTTLNEFLDAGQELERDGDQLEADVDLARLAAVALLHRGFEPDLPGNGTVPRAWFVDLETLFERAVRTTLAGLLSPAKVDRGETYGRRLFWGGVDRSRTHPDLVVHRSDNVQAVGDVKYKSLAAETENAAEDDEDEDERAGFEAPKRKEGRPDIYQVIAHAASLGSDKAFLVYAGEGTYACRFLGTSATGCRTWAAQVSPTHLVEDLSALVEDAGLADAAED